MYGGDGVELLESIQLKISILADENSLLQSRVKELVAEYDELAIKLEEQTSALSEINEIARKNL